MNIEVKKFIPVADFLSKVIGDNTEILIHDFTNIHESIVHIVNGHLSNRAVGDSITDLALDFLINESKAHNQFICNYNSKTIDGKVLYSSTFFIRDNNNDVVGALCLNSDYSEVEKSFSLISSFLPNFKNHRVTSAIPEVKENLQSDSQQLTLNKIDSVVNECGITPDRMTIEEKTNIISQLHKYGVFMLRGSVQEAANKLSMSEPSVYRYIKKIKNESN